MKDEIKRKTLRILGRGSEHINKKKLKCSFCGKPAEEVQRLLAGPAVYICDGCVEKCNQILAQG